MHRHESSLAQRGAAATVVERDRSGQRAVPQIQLLPVGGQRHTALVEPLALAEAHSHSKPVRQVDQILLLDDAAINLRGRAVVPAGQIRAWIVHIVSDRPGCGAARREVPVGQRAQSFARAFLIGIEPLKGENPRGRRFDRDLHVREAGHDHVGASAAQIHGLAATIDADDQPEIAGTPGLHTGGRIFDDDRPRRLRFQTAHGLEECIRLWLALQWHAGKVTAIDPGIEQVGDLGGREDRPRSSCSTRRRPFSRRRLEGFARARWRPHSAPRHARRARPGSTGPSGSPGHGRCQRQDRHQERRAADLLRATRGMRSHHPRVASRRRTGDSPPRRRTERRARLTLLIAAEGNCRTGASTPPRGRGRSGSALHRDRRGRRRNLSATGGRWFARRVPRMPPRAMGRSRHHSSARHSLDAKNIHIPTVSNAGRYR